MLPPLRVCVIGPLGSGKSNCCKLLSEESGVPHIDFDDYLAAHLAKLDAEELADVQKVIDETGIPSSDVLNDIAKNIFTMEPLSTSGFIIENFPKSKAGVDFMNKQLYHVDAVVHLKVDSDVLVSRKTKELTKTYAKMQVTQPEKAEEAQTTEIEAFSDM